MSKVPEQVAQEDIERWLEARMTSDKKRRDLADSIKELEGAVMDGNLIVKEDGTLLQKLIIPIGEESKLTEVKYKLRITAGDVQKRMVGNKIKATDLHGTLLIQICAATDLTFEQVAKMDYTDYAIATAIGNFF